MEKFQYSRPFRKGEKDPDNEFAVSYDLYCCVFTYRHENIEQILKCVS